MIPRSYLLRLKKKPDPTLSGLAPPVPGITVHNSLSGRTVADTHPIASITGLSVALSVPTGTGFRHVTAGIEDAAAKLVDTADVNAAQITYAKIQNVTAARVLGRATGAGSGDTTELTGAQVATIAEASVNHNALTNLATGDVHTQYAYLPGRGAAQTLIGGNAAIGLALIGGTATNQDMSLRANNIDLTTGKLSFLDTLEATDATTAAAVFSGGAVVTKRFRIEGTNDSTTTTSGAFQCVGGGRFAKRLRVESTTDATSLTAGALQVSGGCAITKQLRIGGNVTADGNIDCFGFFGATGAGYILGAFELGDQLTVNSTLGANLAGIVTLVAGTATVTNAYVTANSYIFLTRQTMAGTPGTSVNVTARTANTDFTITSQGGALDTSKVAWFIMEPV